MEESKKKAVKEQLQNAMLRKQIQKKYMLIQAIFFLLKRGCLLLTEHDQLRDNEVQL